MQCLQVRFWLSAATQAALLALAFGQGRAWCARFFPVGGDGEIVPCRAGLFAAQALLGCAAPALLLATAERRFRRRFLHMQGLA
jgi:hypothetical protein